MRSATPLPSLPVCYSPSRWYRWGPLQQRTSETCLSTTRPVVHPANIRCASFLRITFYLVVNSRICMSFYGYFVFFTKSILIIQHINDNNNRCYQILIHVNGIVKWVFYKNNVGYSYMSLNSGSLPVRYRTSPLPPHWQWTPTGTARSLGKAEQEKKSVLYNSNCLN